MEEERRPDGRRERSRPSKAAFTPPPEEDPAAAPPPPRPPTSRPAPSVLFQAPEVPDEQPEEPPRPARPAKPTVRDEQPEEPPRPARPARTTTPETPATAPPPPAARAAKRASRDAPAAEVPAQTRPGKVRTPEEPAAERPVRGRAVKEPGIEDRARSRPAKKAAAGVRSATTGEEAGESPAAPATEAPKKAAAKKVAKKAAKKATAATAARAAVTAGSTARKAVALVSGSVVARTKAEDGPATTPRLLDRPGHAPELLAVAAVRAIGPQARDWVSQTRATYPAATADGLARLATRRFVRMAGAGGAVSAAFGLLTPMAELTATAWAQAALVLHLAAAYGRDPLDAERAVDLLVLVGVHPSPEVARVALAEAAAAEVDVQGPPALRAAEGAWRLVMPLSGQSRGWLAVRMVARRLPGVVPVTAAVGAAAAVERLAYRARAHYRTA